MEEKIALVLIASIVIVVVIIGGIWYSSFLYVNSESKEECIQEVTFNNNITPSPSWNLISEKTNYYNSSYANIQVFWRAYIGYFQEYGGYEIIVIFSTNISANDYLVGYGDSKPTFTIALETVENISYFVNNGFGFQDLEKIGPLSYGSRAYTPDIIANWAYSNACIKNVYNAPISAMVSPPPEKEGNITLLYTLTAYIKNNGTIHDLSMSFPVLIHYTYPD